MPALSKLYTKRQIDALREGLISKHGNQCALCQKPRHMFKKNLSVDHSHKTNRIRGLLCYRCNKFVIGRQTIETLVQALKYLLKYDVPVNPNYDAIKELQRGG